MCRPYVLRPPTCISSRRQPALFVLRYQTSLNDMAPSYLNLLVPVSNLPGRRRLRSSFTQQLLVPPYRLSTVGRRFFSLAASTFWNTLPNDFQSAPTLSSFRRQLKTFLFHQSFPDIILLFSVLRIRGLRNSLGCFSHVKNIDLHYITYHCCSSAATSRRHCFSHHSVRLCDRL